MYMCLVGTCKNDKRIWPHDFKKCLAIKDKKSLQQISLPRVDLSPSARTEQEYHHILLWGQLKNFKIVCQLCIPYFLQVLPSLTLNSHHDGSYLKTHLEDHWWRLFYNNSEAFAPELFNQMVAEIHRAISSLTTQPSSDLLKVKRTGYCLACGVGLVEQGVKIRQQGVAQGKGFPHGLLGFQAEGIRLLRLQSRKTSNESYRVTRLLREKRHFFYLQIVLDLQQFL